MADTDCTHCGFKCWQEEACSKIPRDPVVLYKHPKRKVFLQDETEQEEFIRIGDRDGRKTDKNHVAMWDADHGTGAFYIIMDAVRQKIALRKQQQREMEKAKEAEGTEHQ